MKKVFFKVLARVNKLVLPSYGKRDLTSLSKVAKMVIAYRYWVTIHSLD